MPHLDILLILLVGAFAHGAFGFGFPLVATPLLALLMDMRLAVMVTLIPTVSINLVSILGERHWREALRAFWPIPVFAVIGSFSGTQLLLSVDPEPFRALLALVLIGYLVTDRLGRSERERRVPAWAMGLFGLCLGLLAGVTNVFAPVLVVYALYTRMSPTLMVATFNLSFLLSKSGQIVGFLSRNAFDPAVARSMLLALPLVLLSLWAGIRVRRRIQLNTYKRLLRYLLWVMAITLLGRVAWRAAA